MMILGVSCARTVADEKPAARRALLVGCTTYDNGSIKSLEGPINDVGKIGKLLTGKFEFKDADVHRLVEGLGPKQRPTREAIVREITEWLIKETRKGDVAVLFFAGHGSQQPDQLLPDPRSDEPDGLDETFLPADTGRWNDARQGIDNAIIDDELHEWVGQLVKKGAQVMVIMDACHSGSGIRGDVSDEIPREVRAEQLVPRDILAAATARAAARAGGKSADDLEPVMDPLDEGDWVALYAAQPFQTTPEFVPVSEKECYGLFTYTLCRALERTQAPSYQELVEIVRGLYRAGRRPEPVPSIEGKDLDRKVLGADRLPVAYRLQRDADDLLVLAGQLHGLTEGSILAVHAPADDQRAEPKGHVRVLKVGVDTSLVEPCEYEPAGKKYPRVEALPAGGLCRLVRLEYGDFRLLVAIDPESKEAGAEVDRLTSLLTEIEKRPDSPVRVVADPHKAEWLLSRIKGNAQQWVLSPRATAQIEEDETNRGASSGTKDKRLPRTEVAVNAKTADQLTEQLYAVAKVQNLYAISNPSRDATEEREPLQVDLELWRFPAGQPEAEPEKLAPGRLARLKGGQSKKNNGDKLRFRVVNRSETQRVDFTLLFIDSRFGIDRIYPRGFADFNQLEPGKDYAKTVPVLSDDTVGLESVLLIAVPAREAQPVSFAFLSQKRLDAAPVATHRGGESNLLPLDRLLDSAAFFRGNTRSIGLGGSFNQHRMIVRDWVVTP
jgi:hypothetical protein